MIGGILRPVCEIRDPVHGYIFITELEKKLLDTPVMQRLHYIRQLAGAHYVYPGADHSRFSHSLGVLHLAGVLAAHLAQMEYLSAEDVQMIRAAALLHDVGHGPFSHIYEELLTMYVGKTHEDLTRWLIINTEVADILKDYGYDPKDVADLAIGRFKVKDSGRDFINQIISSPFDVDKMDFLVRDSHFTGVEYGVVDVYRLIYSMDVIEGKLALRLPGALSAIEAFLIARYEMFKAVYFHRTVRSAEIMLIKAMDGAKNELGLIDFKSPEEYLLLDDSWVLSGLRRISKDSSLQKDEDLKIAAMFYKMLESRRLLKCAHEAIIHLRDRFMASLLIRPEIRRHLEKEVADKAGIDSSKVIIDVPTVPSIPYTPRQLEPFEIPVFELDHEGKPIKKKLTDLSTIINVLQGYVDVARVYTFPEHRALVAKVAKEVFGEGHSLLSVSV
ncbi:MAG: hypothetical protein DRN15_02595 [Thermoprotei archaeon]|nr:MAG: hypothetical protein DRM97_04705 [Thermoprotei archaeon]RLF24561.1 MAG: hypothetical protein DRN15_02595 [Thermoprotei archaeon]